MQIDNFLVLMKLKPGADLSNAGSRLLEFVKALIQSAQEKTEDSYSAASKKSLETIYRSFFAYAAQWAGEEKAKHLGAQDHKEAERLKNKGTQAVSSLEDNIIAYAQCYREIYRSIGLILLEHQKYAGRRDGEKIKWNTGDVETLHRYFLEKQELETRENYLQEAFGKLGGIESAFTDFREQLKKALGEKNVEDNIRPVRAALRKADFALAHKKIAGIGQKSGALSFSKSGKEKNIGDIKSAAEKYIKAVEDNADFIRSEDKRLLLDRDEVKTALDSTSSDIQKKNAFIAKYCIPYIEHQIRRLSHLREKLLVVGSLDSLITLYIRLFRGLARPLKTIKEVREYESGVIENVIFLITGQFKEIERINERNADIMEEFTSTLKAFESLPVICKEKKEASA